MLHGSTSEIDTPFFQGLPLEAVLVVVRISSIRLFNATKFQGDRELIKF